MMKMMIVVVLLFKQSSSTSFKALLNTRILVPRCFLLELVELPEVFPV